MRDIARETRIEDLLAEAENSDESTYERPERRSGKRYSTRRTIGRTVLGIVLVGGVMIGGAMVAEGVGWTQALAPHIEAKGSIAKGGHATIEKISMKMPPITLATAETKVTGEKVAFEEDFEVAGLSIPTGQQTVTRDANVETLITLNPGDVDVSFDSVKNKLTYSVPDSTLTTKVDIPTGEAKTSETSGSITTFSSDVASAMANSIAGTFGNDASSVPLLGEIAGGKTSVTNGLESFADLAITTGVDQKCTPIIEKIPGFTAKLKDNIKTAVEGQVMASDKLPALMDMPLKDVRNIMDKATVEMPTDYKIGPDQTAIASFNKYIKSKMFSTDANGVPPIKCGVSESAKLSLVDNKDGSK